MDRLAKPGHRYLKWGSLLISIPVAYGMTRMMSWSLENKESIHFWVEWLKWEMLFCAVGIIMWLEHRLS